jgi:hypothetical protein
MNSTNTKEIQKQTPRCTTTHLDQHRIQIARDYDVQDTDIIKKILGMQWNTETDILSFQQTYILQRNEKTCDRRQKMFYALVLLTPIMVRAKIILQQNLGEKV